MVRAKKLRFTKQPITPPLVQLDLGTGKGKNRPEGFLGVDSHHYPGARVVDLRKRWPWPDNSVDAVHCNHLLQFFTSRERVHFTNELYRILKPGAKATIITPYWAACKGYGDTSTCWPPVSEAWYARLNKVWREAQDYDDPDGYTCDFEHTIGYGLHQAIVPRNLEYQQHAVMFYKEAVQDLIANLMKK
jgi:SAM-dependent methyltransferase